jgi:peptidoglycan L-alanyl-D-glutamate endopeptidase CwlK
MKSHETVAAGEIEPHTERYKRIDERNQRSFLLVEGSTLEVIQSLHSVGAPRDILTPELSDNFDDKVVEKAQKISRVVLSGNMSPLNGYGPSELTPEQRIEDAKQNIDTFLYLQDIDPADVRLLRPERDYTTPLSTVNLDDTPLAPDDTGLLRPDKAGDLIYTYNQETVLAARPADCPIVYVEAETPKGTVTVLLHLAWAGVAHGYVQQAKKALDNLEIDWGSARVQVTPGAHGESYTFEEFTKFNPRTEFPDSKSMFVDFKETKNDKGEDAYNFGIDVAAEVYEQIINTWDINEYNIFHDTTDTTSPSSGYSSHSRSHKQYAVDGDNTRDLFLARRQRHPLPNPDKVAPPEVLADIKPIRVRYTDFEGNQQTGTIEIHKDLAEDVKQFFEKAVELGFPIQHVVKSSDEKYEWDDDKLMADNATTGFNYRLIKGTDRPSLHGLGRAFDVNDVLNPYIRYVEGEAFSDPEAAIYNPSVPGTLSADHELVSFMKSRGWEWGGDWLPESGRTDYQHFQKAAE